MKRILLWTILVAALVLLVACATPRMETRVCTWGPGGTTATLSLTVEEGGQLFFGARHQAAAGPGAFASVDTDKSTTAWVLGAAIGTVGGALAGMPALGMLGGAAGGLANDAIHKNDKASTTTAAALAPLVLGRKVGAFALPGLGGVGGGQDGPQVNGGAVPTALVEMLAAYVEANPQSCELARRIGGPQAAAIIRQLGGGAGGLDLSAILTEVLKARAAK